MVDCNLFIINCLQFINMAQLVNKLKYITQFCS